MWKHQIVKVISNRKSTMDCGNEKQLVKIVRWAIEEN